MIDFPKAKTVNTSDLAEVIRNPEMIAVLVRQAVAQQVEAHLDLMADYPEEYMHQPTAIKCLEGAKETVAMFLEEVLEEFREKVWEELAKTEIDVQSITYAKSGDIDANVVVK